MPKFIAAAVQWSPSLNDPIAGSARAVEAIDEAAAQGAKLVVFPEAWLQGYPYFMELGTRDPLFHQMLADFGTSAVEMSSPLLQPVFDAAKRNMTHVVFGLTERAGGTCYNTQVFVGPDGRLLGKHRKLVPTASERIVWGMGDGSDLDVYDTDLGKLGGLICFEHQMPLARYALCSLGVQIHASTWPGFAMLDGLVDAATRQLAFENGCFVVVAREFLVSDGLPKAPGAPDSPVCAGGSAIIGPFGEYLAGPVFGTETIVLADIDLDAIQRTKSWYDGVGHYARPDVFRLHWDRRPKPPVVIQEEGLANVAT